MTRKEALLSIFQFSVDDNTVNKVFIDKGIDPDSAYTTYDKSNIDICCADLCLVLLNQPDISEGSFSIKYDKAALRFTREEILRRYGLKESYEW